MICRFLVFTSVGLLVAIGAAGASPRPDPAVALDSFAREMASRHGMDHDQILRWLGAARFRNEIIESILQPAEALPWHRYRERFVNEERVRLGARYWHENRKLLRKAEQVYGVAPEIIVAIIGVETRYGKNKGRYPVLDALVTLTLGYPRRSDFFRRELEQFLLLSREESLDPVTLMGSYAGAIGEPQFISSSYRHYAVDFDGDRRRDLVSSRADVIGSVANYLREHGWETGGPVVMEAGVREPFSTDDYGLEPGHTVAQLKKRGIVPAGRIDPEQRATVVRLEGENGYLYRIGFQNFHVITRYNRSAHYAMAVYELSQGVLERYREGDDT